MNLAYYTLPRRLLASWARFRSRHPLVNPLKSLPSGFLHHLPEPLSPLRRRLDLVEVNNPKFAQFLCRFIPTQCPFERDLKVWGRVLFHIPPLCKLNPFYEELVALRFRALCYLADECGEDIGAYIGG
ncbi:MAG: Mo-dependent nitrogenase C-terminal domain-containing protein [Limnospira sp.]